MLIISYIESGSHDGPVRIDPVHLRPGYMTPPANYMVKKPRHQQSQPTGDETHLAENAVQADDHQPDVMAVPHPSDVNRRIQDTNVDVNDEDIRAHADIHDVKKLKEFYAAKKSKTYYFKFLHCRRCRQRVIKLIMKKKPIPEQHQLSIQPHDIQAYAANAHNALKKHKQQQASKLVAVRDPRHDGFDTYMKAQLEVKGAQAPKPHEWPVRLLKEPVTTCFTGIEVCITITQIYNNNCDIPILHVLNFSW